MLKFLLNTKKKKKKKTTTTTKFHFHWLEVENIGLFGMFIKMPLNIFLIFIVFLFTTSYNIRFLLIKAPLFSFNLNLAAILTKFTFPFNQLGF